MANVKVPVLLQLVVEVDAPTDTRWELGDSVTIALLESALYHALQQARLPIRGVGRVKIIDAGGHNVVLEG